METAVFNSSKLSRPAVFSRDARLLFVPVGNVIKSYFCGTGAAAASFVGHSAPVSGCCLHPTNHQQLLSTSLDGTLRAWDINDGTCLAVRSIGLPLVALATAALAPTCAPLVFVVALLRGAAAAASADDSDEEQDADDGGADTAANPVHAGEAEVGSDYPLGEEPACLQVRPPGYALAATIDATGRRRKPDFSRILEIDLSNDGAARLLAQRRGFVTGISARSYPVPTASSERSVSGRAPDVAVGITLRKRLLLYRTRAGNASLTVYKSDRLLASCALHPREPLAVTADFKGPIVTWFPTELSTDYAPAAESRTASASSSVAVLQGSSTVRKSEVHWHAHSAWATVVTPDGSILLSGGEESTLVLWQLPSGMAGGGGPIKDKRHMLFVPRLGAPIRCLSAWTASGDSAAAPTDTLAADTTESAHVRDTPPMLFAVVLVDGTLLVLHGVTHKPLWSLKGLEVAGIPAAPSVGVLRFLAKAKAKAAERQLRNAQDSGDAQAALRAQAPPSDLFPDPALPTLWYAFSRQLSKGCVLDPRTGCLWINAFPGKASLQLYDVRTGAGVAELDVAPRNLVSRMDDEPPVPTRVTHLAMSADGSSMATVEVTPTADSGGETTVLKFWSWQSGAHSAASTESAAPAAAGGWSVVTRVDAPHKTAITSLEYSPVEHLVVTGSKDRTFKQWRRETTSAPAPSSRAARFQELEGPSAASAGAAEGLNRKERRAAARAASSSAPTSGVSIVKHSWSCFSVGFYRDSPVTAAAFSGDGSLLAVAYGATVSLWSPMANTLRRTLQHPAGLPTLADASTDATVATAPTELPAIEHMAFLGHLPVLVTATKSAITCWHLLTCTVLYTYACEAVSLAVDKAGSSATGRYAVVVRDATRPGQAFAALLFAGTSATPVAVWRLNGTTALGSNTLNILPFAISFVPSSSGQSDLCVFGPHNDWLVLSTPGSAAMPSPSTETAQPDSAAQKARNAKASRAPTVTANAMATHAPAAAMAVHIQPASAGSSADHTAFNKLAQSFGGAAGLPSASYVLDALLPGLLPPARTAAADSLAGGNSKRRRTGGPEESNRYAVSDASAAPDTSLSAMLDRLESMSYLGSQHSFATGEPGKALLG